MTTPISDPLGLRPTDPGLRMSRAAPGAQRSAPDNWHEKLELGEEFQRRFHVVGTLGRGGTSAVVKALDMEREETVAIKFMAPDLVGLHNMEERFGVEARTLASIFHPNVVRVLDWGLEGELPYIVFECVEGPSVHDELGAHGHYDVYETLEILCAVLEGLRVVHARGVIHRDIKAENVLLAPGRLPKLVDFGLAKISGSQLTAPGVVLGTPHYMAPEASMRKVELDHRVDLYAIGVLLYEMLTGQVPYDAEKPMDVALAHHKQPVPRLGTARSGLPDLLDELVARSMAKEREHRYKDAREMRAALLEARAELEKSGYGK